MYLKPKARLNCPNIHRYFIKTHGITGKYLPQNDHTGIFSSKGKTPWISHNGKAVADSQFSIDYLNSVYDIDLNRHLTAEQRAISRAFQKMTEENLYW